MTSSDPQATGPAEAGPVTLINVFEIPFGQIDGFVEGWTERSRIMSAYPGFRDAVLHRAVSSKGRFQLANVSHWDSEQLYDAAHLDPAFLASRARVADHAPGAVAHPQLYVVVADM